MTIDIDAIRQREQAATPEPWSMRDGWGPSNEGGMRFRRIANATHDGVIEPTHDGELAALQADAEFIAHARQDIPALLAEVAKLSARNKVWEDHLRQAQAKLADLADKLHKANADNDSLTKAADAWANEVEALRKQICLVIACSDCGEALEWDGGIVHFRNLDEAKDILDDEGWRVIDGKPMCGDCCHLKPHTFKPEPLDQTCPDCETPQYGAHICPGHPAEVA